VTRELCTLLDWDTEFFGFRIGRVNVSRLTPEDVPEIIGWCRDQKIRSLYFLADCGHRETIRLAEKNGFYLVDLQVMFEHVFEKEASCGDIATCRLALPEDLPGLKAIARTAYQNTRFYYDDHFPEALCSRLYEVWIENSVAGYADAVLVMGAPGTPEGYISCHVNKAEKRGKIGLVGVSEEARGHGVGKALLLSALNWFRAQGMESVQVVTQGRNLSAQRLYQRCGFMTGGLKLWYHQCFAAQILEDKDA